MFNGIYSTKEKAAGLQQMLIMMDLGLGVVVPFVGKKKGKDKSSCTDILD